MCATLGVPLAKERCAAAQCESDIGRSSKPTYDRMEYVYFRGVEKAVLHDQI